MDDSLIEAYVEKRSNNYIWLGRTDPIAKQPTTTQSAGAQLYSGPSWITNSARISLRALINARRDLPPSVGIENPWLSWLQQDRATPSAASPPVTAAPDRARYARPSFTPLSCWCLDRSKEFETGKRVVIVFSLGFVLLTLGLWWFLVD